MRPLTFGFEQEFFVIKKEEQGNLFVRCPSKLEQDACGYLAEARGAPASTPTLAAFDLLARVHRLRQEAITANVSLLEDVAFATLPPQLLRELSRERGKGPQRDFSMSRKWNAPHYSHAGLHVHFGYEYKHAYTDKNDNKREFSYLGGVPNIPRIVMALDQRFTVSIKGAKRALGLYELKTYGFEYRSLPTTISVTEVADFLEEFLKGE